MTQRARNLTAAVALMAASLYWFQGASDYRPLSRLYPQVVAGIVFVLAVVLAILTLVGHGPVIVIAKGDAGERHVRSGTLVVTLVVWTALIPVLGLLTASIIGVTVMGVITFKAQVGTKRAIIIAAIAVLLFYFFFEIVLYVPFPQGLLFG